MSDHYYMEYPASGARKTESTTLFGRLSEGKTIGKHAPLILGNGKGDLSVTPTNILEVSGPDDAAMAMCLTIAPPKFVPESSIVGFPNISPQDVNGFSSIGALTGIFPMADLTVAIEWGSGGIQQSAEIDIRNGAVVNLHASYVRVQGRASQVEGGANSGGVYQLAASISPGEGKGIPSTLTTNFPGGLAIAANTGQIAIPTYAHSIRFVSLVSSLQVRFWRDWSRTKLVSVQTAYASAGVAVDVLVPNGAYVVDLNNASGAPTTGGLSVIFLLSI